MNRFITSKQHYKMYKKGRFWVFAGITVATFTLNPLISRADTETTTAATAATTTAGASSSSNSQVLRTTTTSTTGATTQSSATAINAATTNTSAQKKQAVSGTTTDSKTEQPVTAVGENENATSNLSTSDSASASSQAKTGSGDSLDQTSNSSVSVASSSQKVTTQNSDYQNDQGTGSESGIQSNVTDTVVADESLQTNRSSVASPSTSTMASISDSDSKDSNETEKVVDSETSPIAVTATTNTITTTNDKVQLNRALLARAATPATVVSTGTLGTSAWQYTDDGVLTIHAGDWTGVGDVSDVPGDFGSELTKVVIDGPINAGTDTSYMFRYNPNLASIDGLENLDTSKVTDFSMMFMGTKIADFSGLAHWNVSSGTSFDSMFASDSRVQSYDLSQWQLNTVQPVSLKRMFSFNTALISIVLSTWNVRMVTDIDGLFNGDKSLTTADLHGWNLLNVTALSSMFLNDTNLTDLDITGWQTGSTLTSTKFMFEGTPGLKAINIASLDMSNFAAVTEADMNKEPADHDMFLNQDSSGNPLPMNLNALTVGSKTYLVGSSLPDIPTGTGYTGKWVNQADATQTYTSSELMALYNGVDNPADTITWVWETSPSYADFTSKNVTGLIAGPKTTWRVADSVATLKDVNGTDIYATADTVVKVISVNGDTAVTTVDTQTTGTYQVDLQYTDAYGKVWQQTSTVAVAVNQGKLVGKPLTIKMGAKPTYTINDLIDTDNSRNAAGDKLSADELATATVTGLDTSKAGTQTVTLAYTDDATGMVHTTTTTVTMVATKADLTMRNSTIIKGPKNSSWDYRQYVTSVTDFDGNPVSLDGLNIVVDQQPDLTQIGSQTVTLTYTDALGNVISVPTQVTVVASQAQVTTKAPLTIWPSEVAQLKVADLVTITAANGNPVDTSTNLTDVTMSSIDTSKGGAQTVTITYTDEAGNLVTAYAKVTVDQSDLKTKLTNPIAGPKAKWDYLAGLEWVKDANGKLLDNLATADIKVVTEPDLSVAMVGHDQTVTLSYTDELGKEHLVTAVVNTVASKAKITAVSDQIIIPDEAKKLTATDLVSELIDAAGNKTTNFDDVTMSGFDAKAIGPQTVTLTYSDAYGNQTTDSTTVTVDFATITGQATHPIAGPTATWDYRDSVTQVIDANGKIIDVGDADITATTPDLTPAKVGKPQTVTLTYTDSLGKVHTTDVIVTTTLSKAKITAVADQIIIPDEAKKLTATDLVSELIDAAGNKITNFDGVTMSGFDAKAIGPQTVTLTYSDAYGNQTTDSTTVTVDSATLTLQNHTQVAGPKATWNYADNIKAITDSKGQSLTLSDAKITVVQRPDLSVAGTYKIVLEYTDDLGQAHTETADVEVTASKAAITAVSKQVILAEKATMVTASSLVSTLYDADGVQIYNFDDVTMSGFNAKVIGPQTVTLAYTDAYGNQTTVSTTVTVDFATLTLQNHTQVAGSKATWNYADNIKAVTDSKGQSLTLSNAKITVVQHPDLSVAGTYPIVIEYTDDLGQVHTKTANVEATASKASITAVSKQVILAENANMVTASSLVSALYDVDGVQIHNFDDVTMSGFDPKAIGPQTVTLTYTDAYGNQTTAQTTVTVDLATITGQATHPIAGPTATWDYRDSVTQVIDTNGKTIDVDTADITATTPDLTPAKTGKPQTVTLTYTDSLGKIHTTDVIVTTTLSKAKITAVADQIIWPDQAKQLTATDLVDRLYDAEGHLITNRDNVKMSVLDSKLAGQQRLTLTYTDVAGNQSVAYANVTVDQAKLVTKPSTVIAGPTATWSYEAGISQLTNAAGQLITVQPGTIKVLNRPDLNVDSVGQQQLITLIYTDELGKSQSVTAMVTAEASQAMLTAKAAVIVQPDAAAKLTANDLVTSLTDASGQQVTDYQIVRMSKLDATWPGVQPVSLTYTDAAGNEVSTVVKVTVDQAKIDSQNRTQIWGPSMTWDYRQQLATVTDSQGHQFNPDQAKITVITGPQLTAKMIDKPQTVTLMYTDDLQQTHTVSATLTLTASQAALVPRPAQIVWAKDAGLLTPANFLQTITGADGTQVSSLTNVKMSAVDASQPGAQTVTLTYTDDYGNEVTTTAQVTVDQAALTTQTARPVAGPTAHWDYQTNFKTVTNAAGEVINVGDANLKVLTGPDLSTAMVGRPQVVTFSYTDELGLTQTTTAEVTTVASRAHMTTSADQVIWPAVVGKLTVADLVTGLTDAWGQTSQNYQSVTMTTINAQQAGKQQVTLTYTDEVGNVKTATTTVTVDQAALTTQPQTVIAGPTAKWDYHQGIGTITDGMGQPIAVNNAAITVVAMPDLTVAHIGQPQTVQLVYTDSLGQQQTALVQVTTVATQAKISTRPVTVIAGPKTTWSLNDSVDWSTSLAADGTLLTAAQRQRVTVDGTLNLRRASNYPLTLSYMDRAGNLITVTTSINVLASQARLQVRDSQLTVGNAWTAQDNFERATDAQGQALTLADIAVDGTVNTQRAGQYTLTYHYTDVAGNQLTKTAVVTVVLPEDDHINTTDPDNNDHGETTNPDNNDHAGIADPSETPKPSERPNDSDGHTVDWGVDDRITTKQQPAAATRAQTKVKTTAEPALPANNEHTSAAKAAATPVTRVTDTTADTLPQTGERDRSAQQGAVVLGLTGLLGLMGLGRRRHTHED
ncbi:bacterial Ig-like domain-containing protein [Lactiplantibacillus plantarum]|uniref:bacterial Ig-like domain-containing protein n=3 Tax=Lactiplantibacillus plantarum TaxID=1590 RepID=UPI0004822822|nr:bacterial Ig-like domain-containing protein [Lactiplantibacillus plantarum]AQX92773.1 cell surface protein [Lactiplantibacillus plantarum]AWL15607.1 BspA family leucine-rich repeat surface protein [Lactiplantibacillus plantarum]AYA79665.1 BspA family leucine-rich repeat surface protein [Lactiplantibacillus plantarum]AYC75423.1 BspA family leucine-rich repeat surface protein [Lactiplantibacillus plantarum]MCT4466792.1 BspA family leucine-rich repeat surface protein [Lactiplantibacillus plant